MVWIIRVNALLVASVQDIKLFINSPGGSVTAGMGVYDAMMVTAFTDRLRHTLTILQRLHHNHQWESCRLLSMSQYASIETCMNPAVRSLLLSLVVCYQLYVSCAAPQMCRCDVQTYCFGLAASMGAFLLGAGTKGKRYSMPNARIMIHQPLGGASGQVGLFRCTSSAAKKHLTDVFSPSIR